MARPTFSEEFQNIRYDASKVIRPPRINDGGDSYSRMSDNDIDLMSRYSSKLVPENLVEVGDSMSSNSEDAAAAALAKSKKKKKK